MLSIHREQKNKAPTHKNTSIQHMLKITDLDSAVNHVIKKVVVVVGGGDVLD